MRRSAEVLRRLSSLKTAISKESTEVAWRTLQESRPFCRPFSSHSTVSVPNEDSKAEKRSERRLEEDQDTSSNAAVKSEPMDGEKTSPSSSYDGKRDLPSRPMPGEEDLSTLPPYRESFELPRAFDFRTWFPMHMSVQLKVMEGKLRTVDLIIEVHDARLPLSGRNPQFCTQLAAIRPHILVLNKMDLIDMRKYRQPIEDYYASHGNPRIVWTDCRRRLPKAIMDLRSCMLEMLRSEPRFNRTTKTEYQVMVVGIPNVGKSSLINSLRSTNLGIKKSAVVEALTVNIFGARPGVTVRVQNRVRILDRPPVYILDTPGVLQPRHKCVDEAMKLALCDLILESATEPRLVADYLLYYMNRTGDTSYLGLLGLPRETQPIDDIDELMKRVCAAKDMRVKRHIPAQGYVDRWDFEGATKMFLSMFREGKLSDHCLDKELLLPYM